MPPEYESQILDLITETGQAFGRQSASPSLSVYHQARFLTNIAQQYHISKQNSVGADKASADEFLRRVSTDFSLEEIDKQTAKIHSNTNANAAAPSTAGNNDDAVMAGVNPGSASAAAVDAAAATANGFAPIYDDGRFTGSSRGGAGIDPGIATSLPPNFSGYLSRIPSFSIPPAPGQDVPAYTSNMANVAPANMRFAADQTYKPMHPSQEHISRPRGPSLSFPQLNVFPLPAASQQQQEQQQHHHHHGYPAVPTDQTTAASYPRNPDNIAPTMAGMDNTASPNTAPSSATGPTHLAFHNPPPNNHHSQQQQQQQQHQHLNNMAYPPPPPSQNANMYVNAPGNFLPNGLLCPVFPEHLWQDLLPGVGDGDTLMPSAPGGNGNGHEAHEQDLAAKMRAGLEGAGGGGGGGDTKLKG